MKPEEEIPLYTYCMPNGGTATYEPIKFSCCSGPGIPEALDEPQEPVNDWRNQPIEGLIT